MVHALGSVKDEPSSLCICGHDVKCVESFVYLGAMIHSSCSSDSEICRCSATTRSTMQSLDRHLWRSRIMNKTKLHLYMAFIIPTMLCGSECWAINNVDMQRIDAVDDGAYEESWTFAGRTLSEMPTSVALPTSHHFHPSLSPSSHFLRASCRSG